MQADQPCMVSPAIRMARQIAFALRVLTEITAELAELRARIQALEAQRQDAGEARTLH